MKFVNILKSVVASAVLSVSPLFTSDHSGAAYAGIAQSEVLFTRKSWQVSLVKFDDDTYACSAEVGSSSSNFLIWADTTNNASLQFYNDAWSFDGGTADIVLRIDSRANWTLNEAQLNQNSVFFTLQDENASYRFLRQVMAGNTLNLYSSSGTRIDRFSLAGSHASILALSNCVDVLKNVESDGNPFN